MLNGHCDDSVANVGASNWTGQQSSHICAYIYICNMYIQKGNQSHLSGLVLENGVHEPCLLFPPCLGSEAARTVVSQEWIAGCWCFFFSKSEVRVSVESHPGVPTFPRNFRERCLGYAAVLNYPTFWSDMCVCSRANCLKTIHSIWVTHWLCISILFKWLTSPSARKSHGTTLKLFHLQPFDLAMPSQLQWQAVLMTLEPSN